MEIYDYLGNNPDRWRSVAGALAYNAGILTQHRQRHDEELEQFRKEQGILPVDMGFASPILWGYALECFFKCLYLKEGDELVRNGEIVRWKHHNLLRMANDLGFSLSNDQRTVLRDLSIITKWSGRHTVDTKAAETRIGHYWRTPEDDQIVGVLVEALIQKIEDKESRCLANAGPQN